MMKGHNNGGTAAMLLNLAATLPHYVREPSCDERQSEWNPVHACCWDALGEGMVYYPEGVDPNAQPDAERLTVTDHGRPWP